MRTKWLKGILVSSVAALSMGALASCDMLTGLIGGGGGNAPEGFNGFVDGQTETTLTLGETWVLTDTVDYVQWDEENGAWATELYDSKLRKAEYTLLLTMGDETIKLTSRNGYELDESVTPGEWTLTYTITEEDCAYKGEYSMKVNIQAPDMRVDMALDESNWTQYYGVTMDFEDLFSTINLSVRSYYRATTTLTSVKIGDEVKAITGDSYQFTDLGEHVFTLTATNAGGQIYECPIILNVVYRDIYSAALYLPEGTTGTHLIPFTEEVTSIQINGQAVAESDATITAEGIQISNALLRQHPGSAVVALTLVSGEMVSANFDVYTGDVDFEDGVNNVVASYGTYAQNGLNGKVQVTDNVGADGNQAVKGVYNAAATNLMNVNFNTKFLAAIFNGGADYFTFDLICDLPYLRFAREGGGWWNPDKTDEEGNPAPGYQTGNNYLVAEANDVGYAQSSETIEYEGKTLYRFSMVYRKEFWVRISNNNTVAPDQVLSTIAIDFSSNVHPEETVYDDKGTIVDKSKHDNATISDLYIDNIHIGSYNNSDDITFADGKMHGNLTNARAGGVSGQAADVVKFGDDYALQVVSFLNTKNAMAFGISPAYLHQVFNVAGAEKLTMNVSVVKTGEDDQAKVAPIDKLSLALVAYENSSLKSLFALTQASVVDGDDTCCYTFEMTKEAYQQYFSAEGVYSGSNLTSLRIAFTATKQKENALGQLGDYVPGKGLMLYFDDIVKVMPEA